MLNASLNTIKMCSVIGFDTYQGIDGAPGNRFFLRAGKVGKGKAGGAVARSDAGVGG